MLDEMLLTLPPGFFLVTGLALYLRACRGLDSLAGLVLPVTREEGAEGGLEEVDNFGGDEDSFLLNVRLMNGRDGLDEI